MVLFELMTEADVFRVGRDLYLVAPIGSQLFDRLIIAAAIGEDDEENGDVEASVGSDHDLEGDDLEDKLGALADRQGK